MRSHRRETIKSDIGDVATKLERGERSGIAENANSTRLALEGLFRLWSERVLRQKKWNYTRPIGELIPAYSHRELHITTSLLKLNQKLLPHSLINISIVNLLREQRGLSVIFGAPGSGKSTLLKQIVKASLNIGQQSCWLPLCCSLQDYCIAKQDDPNTDLLMFSLQQLGVKSRHQQQHWSALLYSLALQKKIKVLLIFDDLHTVPMSSERIIKAEIQALSEAFNVIACTANGDEITSLRVDDYYQISRLTEREWPRLVENYCRLVDQPERSRDLVFVLSRSEFAVEFTQSPLLLLVFAAVYLQLSVVLERVSVNLSALYQQIVKQLYIYQTSRSAAQALAQPRADKIEKLAFEFNEADHRRVLGGSNQNVCYRAEQNFNMALKHSVFFTRDQGVNSGWYFGCQSLQSYFCARYVLRLTQQQLSALLDKQLLNPKWLPVWEILVASDQLPNVFWEKCRQLLALEDKYSVVIVLLSKLVINCRSVDVAYHKLELDLAQRLADLAINSGYGCYYRAALERLNNRVNGESRYQFKDRDWSGLSVNPLQHRSAGTVKSHQGRYQWQSLFSDLSHPQSLLRMQPWKLESLLVDRGPGILKNIVKVAGDAISVQYWLLNKLGLLEIKLALWILKRLFVLVKGKRLQRKIISALGKLNDSRAQSFLYGQLTTADEQQVVGILTHLQVLNVAQSETVRQFIAKRYANCIRLQAIRALSYNAENNIIYQLQALARLNSNTQIKQAALKALQGNKLLGSIAWVVDIIKNESLAIRIRAAAFELLMGYRNQHYPQVPASLESILYQAVVTWLRQPSGCLSDIAAKNSASFGPGICKLLMDVCVDRAFNENTRTHVCQALVKLADISAIPKLLQLLNHHSYPGGDKVHRHELAWSAAQAIVVLDLEQATQSKSRWVSSALADHCLRANIMLVLENTQLTEISKLKEKSVPKLDFSGAASEQLNLLRELCLYLLANNYVSLTANNPKRVKPPLFDKPSPASISTTNSVNINTGRKFLRGESISAGSANKILLRLKSLPFAGTLY